MSDSKKCFGKVVWFSKGYGFIEKSDGSGDIFLHFSDLVDQPGFKTVKKDQKVEFEIGKNNRGQDKAIEVKVIN